MTKTITARDTISGKVGQVPEIYLELPNFKDHLVRVDDDAKDADPAKYKPTTAKDYSERKATPKKLHDNVKPDEEPKIALEPEVQ